MRCCWDAGCGLETSKRLFTGLRLIVLFFDFPEESRRLLGPGEIGKGTRTGTYSTRPSSTIFEILTPDRDVESSDDGLMPPTAYHCPCESLTTLRRPRASFTHPHTSATTWEQNVVSTWLHGSKTTLCLILSEMAADSANMTMPESEKKFRWVKCGLLTKSCTQRMALCTSFAQINTRSKLMMNHPPQVTSPRTIRAVSWKTWKNKISFFQLTNHATLPYWSRYIFQTDADEHENQPPKSKTTGHHLCQGGSSSKTAPAVVAPERRTGIQPGKPQSHCPWSIHDPKDHLAEDPTNAVAHGCLLRWWLLDRNNSTPVQSSNGQPQSTAQRSWTPPKIYGRLVGIPASNMNFQSC